MRRIVLTAVALVVLLAGFAWGQGSTMYPTLPGTNIRDFSQPGVRYEQNRSGDVNVYPTMPGTTLRDHSRPGYTITPDRRGGSNIYPTLPGTTLRDFSRPGFRIE